MSVKFSFDSKKLMKDLEKELKKSVESEVKNNPQKFLKGHEGKQYSGKCPKCGHNAAIIAVEMPYALIVGILQKPNSISVGPKTTAVLPL